MAPRMLSFATPTQTNLEGILHLPPGTPNAAALLVHCFPADSSGACDALTAHLLDRGCAVLQVDAGLAAGAAMREALAPDAVAAASAALQSELTVPQVLIGHSYGGALALAAAQSLDAVRAVVTINAPAGAGGFSRRAAAEPGRIRIGSQNLLLPATTTELGWDALRESVEQLRRPLLILHAPMDNVAELASAAQIFTAAKHPKSFVAVDSGDHLLSRPQEAQHVIDVVCGWAARYLRAPAETADPTPVVVEESGSGKYRNRVVTRAHRLIADEPVAVGGLDAGPSPYDLLCAALGACTSMTIRMYADLKQLPLSHVSVAVKHGKVHASDCAHCDTKEGKIDRIERVITLEGNLDEAQRAKILEIANKCPVHRTLHSEVWVPTELAPAPPRD